MRSAPALACVILGVVACAGCSFRDGGFAAGGVGLDGAGDGRPADAGVGSNLGGGTGGAPGGNDAARDTPAAMPDVLAGKPDVPVVDMAPSPPDIPAPMDLLPPGCPPGTKMCGAACIPVAGCCSDSECNGDFACVAATCSTTTCRAGWKRCGPDCIAMNACCRAQGCCADADCGLCQRCLGGACISQSASEDLKNECPGRACQPGRCNGAGACTITPDGMNGPSCQGECERCQGGACRPRTGMCSTGQMCADGHCPPRPPVAIRINVNGPAHGMFAGDPGVGGICGGLVFATDRPINGTDDDALYTSEMFGAPLTCAVGAGMLPTGPYQVVLHFAEIYFGPTCLGGGAGPGARVFDIRIEGVEVARNVDLYAEAGCPASLDGSGRPVIKRFNAMITDGTLDLVMPASVNNAKLSAVELLSAW
jgi:hypothetical protein